MLHEVNYLGEQSLEFLLEISTCNLTTLVAL